MQIKTSSLMRTAALTAVIGSFALSPVFAANSTDESMSGGPPDTAIHLEKVQPKSGKSHRTHKPMTAEERRQHVEARIKSLHDRLGITAEQESDWSDVANAMRESEANVGTLIESRQANKTKMNAVEDLNSYQKIAQAHADGLKKVNASFERLYDDMPDAQKKTADQVFDKFQGHGMKGMHKKAVRSNQPKGE